MVNGSPIYIKQVNIEREKKNPFRPVYNKWKSVNVRGGDGLEVEWEVLVVGK